MTDSYYFPGTLFEIEHKCYCWTCIKFKISSLWEKSGSSALLLPPKIGKKNSLGFPLCFTDIPEQVSRWMPLNQLMDREACYHRNTSCIFPGLTYPSFSSHGVTVWTFPSAELTQEHCHLQLPCLPSTLDLEQERWCGVSFWLGLTPAAERCQVNALPVVLGG